MEEIQISNGWKIVRCERETIYYIYYIEGPNGEMYGTLTKKWFSIHLPITLNHHAVLKYGFSGNVPLEQTDIGSEEGKVRSELREIEEEIRRCKRVIIAENSDDLPQPKIVDIYERGYGRMFLYPDEYSIHDNVEYNGMRVILSCDYVETGATPYSARTYGIGPGPIVDDLYHDDNLSCVYYDIYYPYNEGEFEEKLENLKIKRAILRYIEENEMCTEAVLM